MQRTVRLVLKKDKDLSDVIFLYNRVVDVHISYCLQQRTLSKKVLHHGLYQEVRKQY
jgi:hypothetical protein